MTKKTKQGKIANDEKMLARIEKLYDDFTPEDGVLMMMYVGKRPSVAHIQHRQPYVLCSNYRNRC